jgi:polyphosphate kinase
MREQVMQRQSSFRFAVPDRATLERLASGPLPHVVHGTTDVSVFRDVFFDTPARDLATRGAVVRLCVRQDGGATLAVEVLDGADAAGNAGRARADVGATSAPAVFAGDDEAARLVRALVDPARLVPILELETLRRSRVAETGEGVSITLCADLVTVRIGSVSADLFELEVTGAADVSAPLPAFARELQHRLSLRPIFADTVTRAREMAEELELGALEHAFRAAREVAVVLHERGALGLVASGDELTVPWAPGFGPSACRAALRQALGHGRARIRLLGVSADLPGRPAIEVWLAEEAGAGAGERELSWLPIDEALQRAGSPGMRNARLLAALQIVSRSSFLSWAPPPGGADVLPRIGGSAEPFERVLQRLEGEKTAFELSPSDVPPRLLLNMELSRLAFDERILIIAEDPATPLLERVRFLGMFGQRRDDFFMSRVAHFKRLLARGDDTRTLDGLTPAEQLGVIAIRARQITERAYRLLNRRLLPDLEAHGIRLERWDSLSEEDRAYLRATYGRSIETLVMPLVADPAHPFPHVRNLRPALATIVRTPEDGSEQLVAVELPGDLPRFVPLAGGRRFVLLENVIEAALPELYPGLEVVSAHTFRVTRSAKLDLTGEPLDILQLVEEEVTRRPFQEVVRLEVEHAMPMHMRHHLLREFQYELEQQLSVPGEQDVYAVGRLVDLAALQELAAIEMPELKFQPLERRAPLAAERDLFSQVAERERLFHFPWDDFEASVERFLHEAAVDTDVVSIKVTLYRTSSDSGVVAALREARARGKEVVALVELKASFDEQRNIEWARELEQDGIRIVFSPIRFKVHAKIALVVRREAGELRRYAYIGTGNLNAATARAYVDLGLLTADPELTREVGSVFNLLTGYSTGAEIRSLLVAPFDMRQRLLRLIERETAHARAGRPARIRVQINGLADRRLIGALYRASQAGVKIDMMVREICALRPGVPRVSENIRVVSLVGRLLQHARIIHFANNGSDEYYIGSADWRPRNLSERVEVATPIRDPEQHALLDRILDATLNDPDAWELTPDGEFVPPGAA